MRGPRPLVELAAVVVVNTDVKGAWRDEALPQAVRGQLAYQALLVQPEGPLEEVHRIKGHSDRVLCVSEYRSDAGEARLVTGGRDKTLCRWKAEDGARVSVMSGHDSKVMCVTSMRLALDQRVYLVSGDDGGTMRVWGDSDGSCVRVVRVHRDSMYGVACVLAPDGSARSVVTASEDGTVRLWHPETGDAVAVAAMRCEAKVTCVSTYCGEGGRWFIAAGLRDTSIRFWDAETGQALCPPRREHTGRVQCITSFTRSDGRVRVVTGSWDSTLRMWNGLTGEATGVATRRVLTRRRNPDCVAAVAVATLPNGEPCVVSGHYGGAVRVWDPETGAAIGGVVGPLGTKCINALAVYTGPDGQQRLAAACSDWKVSVFAWRTRNGLAPGEE